MMKKILVLAAAAALALTLTACGGTPVKLPTLAVLGEENTSSAVSASSAVSGTPEESSSVSGGEESSQAPEIAVLESEFDDNLEGLCRYLEANHAVTSERTDDSFTEMSYKEIGAIRGFRYRFLYNGSTVQAEFYEFDLDNLDEKGKACLESVKAEGKFTVLDSEVPAVLSNNGKYLMIYTDSNTDGKNTAQRENVEKLFREFKQ